MSGDEKHISFAASTQVFDDREFRLNRLFSLKPKCFVDRSCFLLKFLPLIFLLHSDVQCFIVPSVATVCAVVWDQGSALL